MLKITWRVEEAVEVAEIVETVETVETVGRYYSEGINLQQTQGSQSNHQLCLKDQQTIRMQLKRVNIRVIMRITINPMNHTLVFKIASLSTSKRSLQRKN